MNLHKYIESETPLIIQNIKECGYFFLKNSDIEKVTLKAREQYAETFLESPLNPHAKKFKKEDILIKPYRKLVVGAQNGLGEPYAQFLMTTYYGDQTHFQDLRYLFDLMITLRNSITHVRQDFGCKREDGFWNACRIHHYLCGGAFMSAHNDTYFPKILSEQGIPFVQVSAILSLRGRDFNRGGGFLIDKKGKKIITDTENSYGGFFIFDGALKHGVDTVDDDMIPDFNSKKGRLAAFCNLYENQ